MGNNSLDELHEKLQQQDELLQRLTEGALISGVIIDQDNGAPIVAYGGGTVRTSAPAEAQIGDSVWLNGETMAVVSVAQRQLLGALAIVVRRVGMRWEVQLNGSTKICAMAARLDAGEIEEGEQVILDPTGSIIMGVVQRPKSLHATQPTQVRWEDIGGNETAKIELREAIQFIRGGDDVFKAYKAKPPKGILFHGPPGCGKTLLGKAAATELAGDGEGAFIYIKAPEVLSMYVSGAETKIRSIFATAAQRKKETGKPSIIFIDEADAILQKRGTGISSDMEKTIVPTFLTEMDGLESSGALVILATNRPDTLDPAVIRDGRIDRRILVDRPARQHGKEIFRINLTGLPLANGATVEELSELCADGVYRPGALMNEVSGALIAGLVERAKTQAIRRDVAAKSVSGLSSEDLMQAMHHKLQEM